MGNIVLETNIEGVKFLRRGKVRDIYEVGDYLLIVATDRVSAFDVVLPTGIPGKGKVLTQISLFWFNMVKDIIENHIVSANVDEFPEPLRKYKDILEGRSMLVKKSKTSSCRMHSPWIYNWFRMEGLSENRHDLWN